MTPTASGKTLCYNLPILHTLLNDPEARAVYLFPTKALAQDQLSELGQWQTQLDGRSHRLGLAPATYDGDTPSADRPRIRKTARLLLTNPDMLHVGILPYHTQWANFLGGLRWVVVDEMHTYRGVFGSHVANVLRRLRRLCAQYGGSPQFICTSATIANPAALAEKLIEQPVTLIDDNGAPRGEKHVILLNPPLLDPEKGIRRSATLEATDRAARLSRCGAADHRLWALPPHDRAAAHLFAREDSAEGARLPRRLPAARSGGPSRQGCAMAACAPWWRPTRWNWASTSASCRRA